MRIINNIIESFLSAGLKRKINLTTLCVIFFLGLLVTIFVSVTETKNLSEILLQKGVAISKNLSLNSQDFILTDNIVGLQRLVNDIKKVENDVTYVFIHDLSGFVLVHTFEKGTPAALKNVNPLRKGTPYSTVLLDTEYGFIRDIAVPVGELAVAHIGMSELYIRNEVKSTTRTLLVMTFVLMVISMLIYSFIITWELKPLELLTVGAGEIGSGNLDHRIHVDSSDEIGILARNFNQMAEDLKLSQESLLDRNKELDKTNEMLTIANKDLDLANEELYSINRELERRVEVRTKEKESLWHQLLQSQKLDSIGRLTGGIAHDFNNTLTTIIGFSSLAIQNLPENSPSLNMVERIYNSGKKAEKLINQLLTFSRKQVLEMKVKNVNSIIEDISDMLDNIISEDVILEINPSSKLKNIMADETQIEQVLMNLVVNARFAMPDGGYLKIMTKNVTIDEEFVNKYYDSKVGEYVMLSVKDTGVGMTKELIERIFEPFFTTRDDGKGAGLGLSTVFGIVKQHDGFITVDSEPEKGSEFRIYLPAVDKKVSEEEIQDIYEITKGSGTIMIVEDDVSIRKLFVDILEPLGYDVIEAKSGEEALDISYNFKDTIDVLLTDVVMPGMNGWELNERIRQKRPGIKTIFTSGFVNSPIVIEKIQSSGFPFIRKPLAPGKLVKTLKETLEA